MAAVAGRRSMRASRLRELAIDGRFPELHLCLLNLPPIMADIWADWLLHHRFGGDPGRVKTMMDHLRPIRDRVLSNARFADRETLLDVGCGDGLLAFGALQLVPTSRVIFADISEDLLAHARRLASEAHIDERCRFVRTPAEALTGIEDSSVDVVTTRSVLIYVSDKPRAFEEFYRVLKPGGRLSIFEPINRFRMPQPDHMYFGFDVTPVVEIARKLKRFYEQLQPLNSDPMMNFDERDLLRFAEQASFAEIHLEFQAEIKPELDKDLTWDGMLKVAPNPRIPNLERAMAQCLTPAERNRFVDHLRPLAEARQAVSESAVAYLWATKTAG
jgi:arsenite methyltransferase